MLFSTATIPGSAHIAPGKPGKINNQDAIAVRTHGETTVFVLTDGCGSQPRSETGADIGANLTANIIMGQIKNNNVIDWLKLPEEILARLSTVIELVKNESFDDSLLQRFMFTICVAVIHEGIVTVAMFGDGFMIIDDLVIPFDSPIPNTPSYIGYLLREDSPYHKGELRSNLKFNIVYRRPVTDIKKTLVLSTDGIRDLNIEDIHHPGLLSTSNALQCWLASQNLEYVSDDEHKEIVSGPCRDDVTMVLIRTEQGQKQLLKGRAEIVKLKIAYNELFENLSKTFDKWHRDRPIRTEFDSALAVYFKRAETLYEIAEEIDALLDCAEIARKVHQKISDLKEIPVWQPANYGMYGGNGCRGSVTSFGGVTTYYPAYTGYGGSDLYNEDHDFMTHGAEPISPRSLQDEKPVPLLPPVSSPTNTGDEAKTNRGWVKRLNKKKKKSGSSRR